MIYTGDSETQFSIPFEDINRKRRLEALQESDWTQVADSPLSESKKAEWAIYRQALRDMPQNFPEVASWTDETFPVQPTD